MQPDVINKYQGGESALTFKMLGDQLRAKIRLPRLQQSMANHWLQLSLS